MIRCKEPPTELKEYIKQHFSIVSDKLYRDDRRNSLGSIDKDGYRIIKVKKHQIKEHRLVWFLAYGEFPKSELDHINRNRLDNRIENLREADRITQVRNHKIKINPDTGVQGIYMDKCTKGLKKKYTFCCCGKSYRFYTLEDAVKAKQAIMEGIL